MTSLDGEQEIADVAKTFNPLESTLLKHRTLTLFGEVNQDAAAIATPATQPKLDIETLLSNSRKLRQSIDAVTQTHLNNMRRNLKHRLQVAREKGDQELIHLLELEEQQMA